MVALLITAGIVVALIGLISKNFVLLFLALPLFLFGGIAINFISIPWYIWALGLVLLVFAIMKKK